MNNIYCHGHEVITLKLLFKPKIFLPPSTRRYTTNENVIRYHIDEFSYLCFPCMLNGYCLIPKNRNRRKKYLGAEKLILFKISV